jgi:hypothetical protein
MIRRNFLQLLAIPFVTTIVNCTPTPTTKSKEWYQCGKFHRQDGPAVMIPTKWGKR